jgi:hydrogenase maturation factor HypF (carbamoyltransferase family)
VKRVILTLTGRVQGIGFRDCVVRIATRHPVAGTVRNHRWDRALEIDVEGDDAAVESFLADVLANPPYFARLDHVVRQTGECPRGLSSFAQAPTG